MSDLDNSQTKNFTQPEPMKKRRKFGEENDSSMDASNNTSSESASDSAQANKNTIAISPRSQERVTPKTPEEKIRLQKAISGNRLIVNLDQQKRETIYDAMFEKQYKAGELIIIQGDVGDNFYVVDSGECDIFVSRASNPEVIPGIAHTYGDRVCGVREGGSFGELAIIHGTPRAATVVAKTDVRVWGIDRFTYYQVLMNVTQDKRKMYSSFLERVPLFASMNSYERLTVADALTDCEFGHDETIIRQGEHGDTFFIVLEGQVVVTQEKEGVETELTRLHTSDFFGERALILNQPRAATVRANGPVKCLKLDRSSFDRLLGPCEHILKRNVENYNKFMQHPVEQHLAQTTTQTSGPRVTIQEPVKEKEDVYNFGSFSFGAPRTDIQSDEAEDADHSKHRSIDNKISEIRRRRYSSSYDRRGGVSSESMDDTDDSVTRVITPKTREEKFRIQDAIASNVLLSHLGADELDIIFDAMFGREYLPGEVIIKQGDVGDNFYVVDSGECNIYVSKITQIPESTTVPNGDNAATGENSFDIYGEKVCTVSAGGSFGELALIHGTPRAATVLATTPVKVWGIDRRTYRQVLMNATQNKRKMYSTFLERVPILTNLNAYERLTVADACQFCNYRDEDIIREGELGDSCYIILEGEVAVFKRDTNTNTDVEVKRLHASDYFGERALLLNQPRAATVRACGDVKCLNLDRKSFDRLLGSCEEILKRNMMSYNQYFGTK